MEWFWRWVQSVLIRGENDWQKNDRLNAVLPPHRSPEVRKAREQTRIELKRLTQLVMATSFGGMAALAGIAEVFGLEGHASLYRAAVALAVAGVAATLSLVFSAIEPSYRAELRGRLEPPEGPMSDADDFQYGEAVNDRLYQAPYILKDVTIWRLVAAGKSITLIISAVAFCAALVVAVGALR